MAKRISWFSRKPEPDPLRPRTLVNLASLRLGQCM